MAEPGRGQEVVITQLPNLEERVALALPFKNKLATTYRVVYGAIGVHSPNVVKVAMAESGRGQEVALTPIPDFPQKKGALESPLKNNLATTYRAVRISFYFQGQHFNKICTTLSLQIIRQHILYYRHGTN